MAAPTEKVTAEARELAGEKSKPEEATTSKVTHQGATAAGLRTPVCEALPKPAHRKSETTAGAPARSQRSKAKEKTSLSTQAAQMWQWRVKAEGSSLKPSSQGTSCETSSFSRDGQRRATKGSTSLWLSSSHEALNAGKGKGCDSQGRQRR